ncbi:hypothetical protein [Burkholderia ubonensis]|uniref:hypothetical protein n=1 Tax=Burkholderia ubonensis TaxID=101571 RepID=UPI0012FC15E9|nr:hypothetical protein [Burkholderia ubonensis]
MKVRYSKARARQGQEADPSFTLGNTYLVLGVRFQPEARPTMVIVQRDSDGTPVMVELRNFDVVDSAVPADWCFSDFGGGSYALEPSAFAGDFWDRYHDANPDAEKVFSQVVDVLAAFHAVVVPRAIDK